MVPCLSDCSSFARWVALRASAPDPALRGSTSIWHFLPPHPVFSPCSAEGSQTAPGIWVARVGPGQWGHDRWPAGPGFLSGRPRATQCPIVPQPLQEASSGREGPGRRCQLFWVTGEDLDLLAVSFFLRRKVNGPSLGSKSVPLARIPKTFRLPLWRRERPVSPHQAGAHGATVFSALGRWARHCSHERLSPLGSLCDFRGPNRRPLRIQNPRLTAPGLGVAAQHTEPGNGARDIPHSALCLTTMVALATPGVRVRVGRGSRANVRGHGTRRRCHLSETSQTSL